MRNTPLRLMLAFTFLMLAASGCATYRAYYDYDPKVRFTELKQYGWLDKPDGGWKLDELTIKRIKSSVERQLGDKGYTLNPANPDFFIAIHGGREKKVNVVDWGYAYRGYEHYFYGRYHPGHRIDIYEYEEGTLILDFIHGLTRELVWRGSVTKVIDPSATPEKREQVIDEAVARILVNFPPPGE